MKETYFCTKTKKIQKKSQKCTENHGNEKSKCDLYGLRYRLCRGGFFCSGYRSLIGKVLRFFSLKFRSLGRLVAESINARMTEMFARAQTSGINPQARARPGTRTRTRSRADVP
jgi:hypothetical protein